MSSNIRKLRRPLSSSPTPGSGERGRSKFTPETLQALRNDVVTGRIPLAKVSISDDIQDGLRALIRKTGLITFHAHYTVGDERPYIKVGHYPMEDDKKAGQATIDDARQVTKTIRSLGDMGIDVQLGLHERLLRELRNKGTKWRPD
jgi:hypothetical protein